MPDVVVAAILLLPGMSVAAVSRRCVVVDLSCSVHDLKKAVCVCVLLKKVSVILFRREWFNSFKSIDGIDKFRDFSHSY